MNFKLYALAVLLFSGMTFFHSCTEAERLNPLDPNSPLYESPYIIIDTLVSTYDDTLFADTLRVDLSGNKNVNVFRWKLNGPQSTEWTNWLSAQQGVLQIKMPVALQGSYELIIQTAYSQKSESTDSVFNFIRIDTTSSDPGVTPGNLFLKKVWVQNCAEGDTVFVAADSLLTQSDSVSFTTLALAASAPSFATVSDSGLFLTPWGRDSGSYQFRIVAQLHGVVDTAEFISVVAPTYISVSTSATKGSIEILPSAGTYRIGDTISLSATGQPGYVFDQWSSGTTETAAQITHVLLNPVVFSAEFVEESVAACIDLDPTIDITDLWFNAARSETGVTACTKSGFYNRGAIEVQGKIVIKLR